MDVLMKNKELNRNEEISGFWGHIGIMPRNGHEYKWYPITKNVRADFYNEIDRKSIVITCMNNKVLYLNMKNINKIVLIDDDCDGAYDCNWSEEDIYSILNGFTVYYNDGREVVLNRENIAMIELPLLSVENAINRKME